MGKRKSEAKEQGQKPKKGRNAMLPPPNPTPRVDRTMSCTSEISMSQVSPRVRETLLNMERVRKIRHPFSEENQEVIQEFRESVGSATLEDVNLTEMSLLLRGVMSLYKRQIGSYNSDVYKLAAFVTNSDEIERPFQADEDGSQENDVHNECEESVTNTERIDKVTSKEAEEPSESVINTSVSAENGGCLEGLVIENTNLNSLDQNSHLSTSDTQSSIPSDSGIASDFSESASEQTPGLDPLICTDGTEQPNLTATDGESINTRKRVTNYADLLHPSIFKLLGFNEETLKSKRPRKNDFPPNLVSYLDIPCRENIPEDEEPPLLICQVGPEWDLFVRKERAKRITKSQDPVNQTSENPIEHADEQALGVDSSNGALNPNDTPCFLSMEGIDKLQQVEFTAEDISEIQRWITQLHYLPFTCELSNAEVKGTFENLLQRLSSIFKKYGVPVNGHMLKTASAVCAKMTSTYKDLFNDPNESFPQNQSKNSESVENTESKTPLDEESELTIMERVTEKTMTESQSRMREMIMEMQKSIVPKYARIPLIEENTAEFFRRVKLFEEKMKKVLASEEKKEEFDVRKYEMEVLDAANKETKDSDSNSISNDLIHDLQIPSPISNCLSPDKFGGFDDNLLGLAFQGLPSPSSSETSDFQKWVPLTQIFTHMKKMEKPEAARVFYAVLALLSFENLDIKYENHYSGESAAITKKFLDHAQDTKYPRGLKIMSSRCPDVDREEIYLSPLTSLSRTNAFRQLELRESALGIDSGISRMRIDRNSSSTDEVINGDLTHDIDREFVRTECSVFGGELFGKVRARNNKDSTIKKVRKKLNFSKTAHESPYTLNSKI